MKAPAASEPPLANLRIERADQALAPGDLLRGSFCVESQHVPLVRSAEISVMWYTAGKGDEDFGVHCFERYTAEGPEAVELGRRREFRTLLPEYPLSYDGVIVKVCWCARLRLFLHHGRQHVVEASFRLGEVAAAKPVELPFAEAEE